MADRSWKMAVVVRDSVGGICRYSHELAQALVKEGAEVLLICRSDFPYFEGQLYRRCAVFSESFTHGKGGAGRLVSRLRLLFENIFQPIMAFQVCRREGVGIAHLSNSFHIGFSVWRFFIPAGLRLGLSVHDVRRREAGAIARLLNRQLIAIYRKASVLFVHDEDTVSILSGLLGFCAPRVCVVPHGHFAFPVGNEKVGMVRRRGDLKTGLFFGSLRDEKRLDLLIRALAARSRKEGWRLIVAGSSAGGQHRPLSYYKKLAFDLGVDTRIEFFEGYVADDHVHQFFDAADWVALTHDNSFTSQSGVLAAAVDFGVPVISCGAPLVDKTVRQFAIGHVCAGDEPADVLAGIEYVEARDVGEFQHGFQRFLREMTWEANARITLEAYESVLASYS